MPAPSTVLAKLAHAHAHILIFAFAWLFVSFFVERVTLPSIPYLRGEKMSFCIGSFQGMPCYDCYLKWTKTISIV